MLKIFNIFSHKDKDNQQGPDLPVCTFTLSDTDPPLHPLLVVLRGVIAVLLLGTSFLGKKGQWHVVQ